MATEHTLVVKATAPKYFKGASDLTLRKRLWLAMIKKEGLIEYNCDSTSFTWNVTYSEPEVRQFGDAGDQEFNEHDSQQQLTVDVRGYTVTDRLTKKKEVMNKGQSAIINLYAHKSKQLLTAIQNAFCAELYVDGYAANNDNRLIGLESFMADDGATVAADLIANPSDTYGGQSTGLGTGGGNWTSDVTSPNATAATDWPYGSGDAEYDYLAPLLVNTSSSSWETGGTDWKQNCEEVLRFTQLTLKKNTGDDSPACHMLSTKLYFEFLNYYSTRQRIIVPHKMGEDLGFPDAMNFEGGMVKHEYDVTSGLGYHITPSQMVLLCSQKQLFVPDGPTWDISSKSYLYEVGFFGNLRFNPKFFGKYKAYA